LSIQDLNRVIVIRLREAMERYRERHGERVTYEILARRTGLARATIESMATRVAYNASLRTIAKLCQALDCSPGDLLELRQQPVRDPPP
jgi:DNA-binding Xre family transcriptional regulator